MSNITKRALEDSLKHLLLKKPVNKITINDICEEDSRKALSDNTTYDTWQQGFLNILHAVEDNKPFIINVYRHVSQEQILQYLYRVVYGLLIAVVEECAQGMTVRDEDKKFIADFYKHAFVGLTLEWMTLEWIKSDMKPSPESIVSRLSDLIDGDIPRMLAKYRLDTSLNRL